MNGRLEPWSTAPMVSMARLSSSQLSANLDQSCRKAVWITASAFGCSAAQAFQVFQIAAMHLSAGGGQRFVRPHRCAQGRVPDGLHR